MMTGTEDQKKHSIRTSVCVTGCIRSGSSMITRILNICGMNLGSKFDILEPDNVGNPSGYWENIKFLYGNRLIMQAYNEDLDKLNHPSIGNNTKDISIDEAFKIARDFIKQELKGNFVGWKDPNNSLTVGFWQKAIPDLKIVVCLRRPMDTAKSISTSPFYNLSFENGLRLWERYYQNVIKQVPSKKLIVTQYENYFTNPQFEISRLLRKMEINYPDPKVIELATSSVQPSLRHYKDTFTPDIDKALVVRVNLIYKKLKSLASIN
jgi:hypothetical protein